MHTHTTHRHTHMYVCICMYVCMYVCVCVCVCVALRALMKHMSIVGTRRWQLFPLYAIAVLAALRAVFISQEWLHVCMCVCVYGVCMCVCVYVCVCMFVCMCVLCVCVCAYVCVCVRDLSMCVITLAHLHNQTHTHTNTHITQIRTSHPTNRARDNTQHTPTHHVFTHMHIHTYPHTHIPAYTYTHTKQNTGHTSVHVR